MRNDSQNMIRSAALAVAVSSLLLIASGCGMNSTGAAGASTGGGAGAGVGAAGLTGRVHGGQQAVSGATIQLYEVGTTSYTTGVAKPILTSSVTSGSDGTFTLTGKYSCDAGSYVYLTAASGNPGTPANNMNNANLTLGAAIGSCDVLSANSATAYINVNEVTTVALAYALAQFSGNTTFGVAQITQPGSSSSAPADNFTTSSTNKQGIINAFAMAQVLASTTTGLSPGNNSNGTATVEYWQINTIADILAACVNSAGGTSGDGSNCGTLFANVNLPSGTNPATGVAYAAPKDTLQAAVYLALNPALSSTQLANLYGLIAGSGTPFNPYAPAVANFFDASVAVSFNPVVPTTTTQVLYQPYAIAIDKYGNAWVGNELSTSTGALVELDPTGNPIQAGSTAGTTAANYQITGYSIASSTTNTTFGGPSANSTPVSNLAIDTNNVVWVPDYVGSNLFKATGSGAAFGYGTGFSNGYASSLYNGGNGNDAGAHGAVGYSFTSTSPATSAMKPVDVVVDGSNNVFVAAGSGTSVTACSSNSAYTSPAGIPSTGNKGLVELVGGNPATVNIGPFNGINAYQSMVIDSGTYDSTTSSGTTTSIAGSSFIYALGYNSGSSGTGTNPDYALDGAYTGILSQNYTSGTSTATCQTPVATISSDANYSTTSASNATTKIPDSAASLSPAISGQFGYLIGSSYSFAADGTGSLWITNTGYLSSPYSVAANSGTQPTSAQVGTVTNGLVKFTPQFGSAFTSAQAAANSTFTVFHDIGSMSSASGAQPRALAIDGGGNAWYAINLTGTYGTGFGGVSASGAALSPAYSSGHPGLIGSQPTVSCSGACYYTNSSSTAYLRRTGRQLAVDASGNVWAANSSTTYGKINVLVGAAVPVTTPFSTGLANGTYQLKP